MMRHTNITGTLLPADIVPLAPLTALTTAEILADEARTRID